MDESFVPRVPRNYVMTEYGLLPRDDVSEEARRLYSNYFKVVETKNTIVDLYSKDDASLELYMRESSDFENREDFSQRWSYSEVKLIVEDDTSLDEFIRGFERFAEKMSTGLSRKKSSEDLVRYKIRDEFDARAEIVQNVRTYNPFRYEDYEEMVFSISREGNEHMLDTSDMCFTEMSRYKDFLREFGIDWESAEEAFYSLDYENLLFSHTFKEVPRDFWEKPRDVWTRLDAKGLEETADALLESLSRWKGNERREREIREDLDYVRRLLETKDRNDEGDLRELT